MGIVRIRRRSDLLLPNARTLARKLNVALGEEKRPNKYHAQETFVDGHRFASKKEAARYCTLRTMQEKRMIRGLTLQPRYKLIVNNHPVGTYVADFRYWLPDGRVVIEDVKSVATRTRLYILKRKLVEALYGIVIEEV
jgi:hypothetical protein